MLKKVGFSVNTLDIKGIICQKVGVNAKKVAFTEYPYKAICGLKFQHMSSLFPMFPDEELFSKT